MCMVSKWAIQIQQKLSKKLHIYTKCQLVILVRFARDQPQISNVYILQNTPKYKTHSHSVQKNVIQGGISFQTN